MKKVFYALILVCVTFLNTEAQPLESFINLGLRNSPLLYDFNNQKLSARFDSLLVLAAYKPQVNQLTQVTHFPGGSGWGYDEAITNGGNYSAVVNVSQSLFNKKMISGQLQSLDLINQTLRINERITTIDLKKSITAQYLTAYADFSQNQFNRSLLALLDNELKTIRALVDKGVYQLTDLKGQESSYVDYAKAVYCGCGSIQQDMIIRVTSEQSYLQRNPIT